MEQEFEVKPVSTSADASEPAFRAGKDQNGDWWVWRKLSMRTWVTHRRCEGESEAVRVADQLASESAGEASAGESAATNGG